VLTRSAPQQRGWCRHRQLLTLQLLTLQLLTPQEHRLAQSWLARRLHLRRVTCWEVLMQGHRVCWAHHCPWLQQRLLVLLVLVLVLVVLRTCLPLQPPALPQRHQLCCCLPGPAARRTSLHIQKRQGEQDASMPD
jgi:hypothetical protein